ncbi:MAG: ABC transporter permease [Actinobacteria bacterium]|nr:MAG: ABC transporter permease [Actinomycetota bacterium]
MGLRHLRAPGVGSDPELERSASYRLRAVRRALCPRRVTAGGLCQSPARLRPELPAEDVVNLQSVDRLPLVLAGLVVLLGAATVGDALVSAVRRRRRDLAILKTMGFVRRQVAAVVAWQATSFCVVAIAVGIPLGVLGGRWAWSLVSSAIGAASPSVVPTKVIALMVPATLAVGNLIAVLPGWAAARVAPAAVMRNE